MKRLSVFLSVAAVFCVLPDQAGAEKIYGLTSTKGLFSFDSSNPGGVSSVVPLAYPATTALAIDFRPETGQLYVLFDLSGQREVVQVDPVNGATIGDLGSVFPAGGIGWGMDFDAAADRLRVVSDGDYNMNVGPAGGAVQEGSLVYAFGDTHYGENPQVVALGITNSYPGATATTTYGYDNGNNSIMRIGNPDPAGGGLFTAGPAGFIADVNTETQLGMDVSPSGTAYVLLRTSTDGIRLYTANLANGALTPIGKVGTGSNPTTRDIAVAPVDNAFHFAADSFSANEGAGKATITVERPTPYGAASVDYATSDGTARTGTDYTPTSGTLQFANGDKTKSFAVDLKNGDPSEGNDTVNLKLSNPKRALASLIVPNDALLFINNDPAPLITKVKVAPRQIKTSAAAGASNKARSNTTFVTFRSSEAATVTFTVSKVAKGRKSGKKCRKATSKNRGRKACKLLRSPRSFTRSAKAGSNRDSLSSRIGKKKLHRGKYELSLKATDSGGNTSNATKGVSFRVVRR